MNRKTTSILLTSILLFTLVSTAILLSVSAQPGSLSLNQEFATATPGSDGPPGPVPTESAEEQRAREIANATLDAEFASRSIFDFHVAYLIAEGTDAGPFVTAQSFEETLGASVFTQWDEFLAVNEAQPFQMVLFHQSSVDMIDLEWTRQAYRDGVPLVGISVTNETLRDITGDHCVQLPKESLIGYFDDTYILINWILELEYPENFESAKHALLDDCVVYSGEGLLNVRHGMAQAPLIEAWGMLALDQTLIAETIILGIEPFAKEDMIPLPDAPDTDIKPSLRR